MIKIARLPCGHNDGWILRLMDKGMRYKYCLGCLIDKVGLKPIGSIDTKVKENISLDKKLEQK